MSHRSCAACRYHRRRCAEDCALAPYFPREMNRQFLNCHKLFTVSRLTQFINALPLHLRNAAMSSICAEAWYRARDPVGGSYRVIVSLMSLINQCQDELNLVLSQLQALQGGENVMAQDFSALHGFNYNSVQEHGFGLQLDQLQGNFVQEHGNVVQEVPPQPHQGQFNLFDLRNEVVLEQVVNPIQNAVRDHQFDPQLDQLQNNIFPEQSNIFQGLPPQPHQQQLNVIDLRHDAVLGQDIKPVQDEVHEERDEKGASS